MPPLPDLTPVAGRIICLDPGHGGPQPGAVANGLRESDVNLRIALRLRELLAGAGAQLLLTRDSDTTLHSDALTDDLAARAELANRNSADVFLSIHHNADIVSGSARNDLEVYYKMFEDGPSLDLGQCLMQGLALGLRPDAEMKRLLPGNYKVLRTASVPAALTESSYMTHAANAAFLATPEASEAEARSLASGLAAYFTLDPPRVASASAAPLEGGRAHMLSVTFTRGLPLNLSSLTADLDGQSAPGSACATDTGAAWVFRDTLANGRHEAVLHGRNMKGAALRVPVSFDVARPAQSVSVSPLGGPLPAPGAEACYEADVRDALGMPVANGTPVVWTGQNETYTTMEGKARFYQTISEPHPVSAQAGSVQGEWTPSADSAARGGCTLLILDAQTKTPVSRPSAFANGAPIAIGTPEGWMALPADVKRVRITCAGYEPKEVALTGPHTSAVLDPVADGALHGRRIVLDPAYGGRLPGLAGPTGLRACDINLDVARQAMALLQQAGADATLTRTGDIECTDLERLAAAEDAELFITISYGAPPDMLRVLDDSGHRRDDITAFIGHYPKSAKGEALAKQLSARMNGIPALACSAYIIQQTPCPAVWIQPASVEDAAGESQCRSAASRRLAAEAIRDALKAYFTGQATRTTK